MLVTTTELLNKDYEIIEVITGSVSYTTNVVKDTISGFKNIGQPEIESCTTTLKEARALALKRLIQEAETLGATAIVGLRFDSLNISTGTFEILAYGTAIKY